MWLKKLAVASIAFAGVAFGAGEAKAVNACQVRLLPGATALGSDGYVLLHTYTGPDCTGSLVGTHYFCSDGATSTSCAASATYRYSAAGLLTLFEALRRAAESNQSIVVSTASCVGGGAGCASFVVFIS